jgi:osmotically-inducible protein OsmY
MDNPIARISLMALTLGIAAAAHAEPAEDAWITAKVKVTLLGAQGVESSMLDVDTLDGVVLLQGEVPLDADRTRAGAVALEVDGVRGVRNLIAVVPERESESMRVADERVGLEVERALASDPDLAGSAIEIESVHGGVVLLSGRADSVESHERVLAGARDVKGVSRVESGIRSPDPVRDEQLRGASGIERPGEQSALVRFVTDAWITARAKLRLMREPGLSPLSIEVDTEGGVVTLSGIVESEQQVDEAEAELMQIDGVVRVANYLQVGPTLATNV